MSSSRYLTLDHWRGFASLWVVLFHASALWSEPETPVAGIIHDFAKFGWFGISLFFVISGYCIAERMARCVAKGELATSFFWDRCLRIFPVYWAAFFLMIVLAVAAVPFNSQPLITSNGAHGALPSSTTNFIKDLLLLKPFFRESPQMLVSWTLTAEVSFYTFVAVTLALFRSIPAYLLPLCFASAALQAFGAIRAPISLLQLWPEFVCGMLSWSACQVDQTRRAHAISILGILLLGIAGFRSDSSTAMLPAVAAFALLLVLLKPFDSRADSYRILRPIAFCGTISFSLYVSHVPIISPIQNLLHRILPDAGHQMWIPFGLTLVALSVAVFFYQLIERPLESWRRQRTKPQLANRP